MRKHVDERTKPIAKKQEIHVVSFFQIKSKN